jgi:nucleoside phosphorylase
MIAILVAVKQELRPVLRRAETGRVVRQAHLDFYEGTLAGQPVALLALGIGKECARIAAEMTLNATGERGQLCRACCPNDFLLPVLSAVE